MSIDETLSVRNWLKDARMLYEAECMTTLQCKSISAELTQKVLNLASRITSPIREVLIQTQIIEKEFDNLKRQVKENVNTFHNLRSNIFLGLGFSEVPSNCIQIVQLFQLTA